MAYLRWLHKTWKYVWTFIGVLVLAVTVICVAGFGLLQLKPVKTQIASELQERFNTNYQGMLHIGSLDGLLPFHVVLEDVKMYPDSSSVDPVFTTDSIASGIDVWSLLQNRLYVNYLDITEPRAVIDGKDVASFGTAFTPKKRKNSSGFAETGELPFQIIIPAVHVFDGKVVFRNLPPQFTQQAGLRTDSLEMERVNLNMFFEFTNEQRFADIDRLAFSAPQLVAEPLQLNGQLYNDDRFLELNALNLKMGNSFVKFTGEADGVNVLEGAVKEQLFASVLSLRLTDFLIEPDVAQKWVQGIEFLKENISGNLEAQGTLDSLSVPSAQIVVGESFANASGYLKHLNSGDALQYSGQLQNLMIATKQLEDAGYRLNDAQLKALKTTRLEGMVSGNRDSSQVNLKLINQKAEAGIDGQLFWQNDIGAALSYYVKNVNVKSIIGLDIPATRINGQGEFRSNSLDLLASQGALTLRIDSSLVLSRQMRQANVVLNWNNGVFEPGVFAKVNGSTVEASGIIDMGSPVPTYRLNGSATQINFKELVQHEQLKQVVADIEFNTELQGRSWNDIYGQFSIDVPRATSEGDSLPRHQLYVDLNNPSDARRLIRFTSTAFDATAEGTFAINQVRELWPRWKNYFTRQIADEITFDSVSTVANSQTAFIPSQDIEFTARVKNPDILRAYFHDVPELRSAARIQSTVNVSSERLLFSSAIRDTETKAGNFRADTLNIQLTGGFRYGMPFKEFSGLQMQASAVALESSVLSGNDFQLETNFSGDSVFVNHSIADINNNTALHVEGNGKIKEEEWEFRIHDFNLQGNQLNWVTEGQPALLYNRQKKLTFREFVFTSGGQRLEVDGTFSTSPEDSVNYRANNVDLTHISNIIGGRISFSGIMDGVFTTRTLTTVPTIQGNVAIERLRLNNQLAGDVQVNSQFDPDLNRFNTNISVKTDSAKYPEYFTNTDRRGQDFDINGYVMAPEDGEFPAADSLYRFNARFNNIDMWILPLIGPKVFAESAGRATGNGVIWGNLDTYDFEAEFMVGNESPAYLKPQFLETDYYAQGGITFTRSRGFSFNDIYLVDPSGGSAVLSGYYDLNDFGSEDSLNIQLQMDEFQFLDSSFDPTVAFFGSAYGTGTVTIAGTNFDPVLRTEGAMEITDFSEISIPLLEETEFNEDNRFIRFVETFEEEAQTGDANGERFVQNGNNGNNQEDLTFAERFTLDLQFVSSNPMTVRLIFDPVTGDIVTAEGTGRLRILLEDEDVSMFGRFNIEGGRYQFVSGDIFTRRFELESGGSITWEGAPDNARLDLNAVYSARPDINSLSTTSRNPETAQRVPVDLVLNIGGTISSIENDFFFRLPNTIETQQSTTLSTQIASINRDEDLKLLQAANFMLMGDFIPVTSTSSTQSNLLADNISGSAAVLNPLISSQVINPLLSNQVNSLLNSDLSSLDVDFNLNTYNQVDLGVALRLYNDKLILRREGQITGRQSNIGDLGATYRINRTFAVTAFHRQDLTFGTLSSTEQSQQGQEINGLGLEAKVSFNTWNEFFDRLLSPFKKLFGIRDREEDQQQEQLTENKAGLNPDEK